MKIEELLLQIREREKNNFELFKKILTESRAFYEHLIPFKGPEDTKKPDFSSGVIGRRLSDKIMYLEDTLEVLEPKDRYSYEDMQRLNKSLNLIVDHLKKFQVPEVNVEIRLPSDLDELVSRFNEVRKLELHVIKSYISFCRSSLKNKISDLDDKLLQMEYKQAIDIYGMLASSISFEGLLQLRKINDDYGTILTVSKITKEYKSIEENLWKLREEYDKVIGKREKLREAGKHLTQYEKNKTKADAYLDEVEKYSKRLDSLGDDERDEIEDLIESYKEARLIMLKELEKLSEIIKTFGVNDAKDHEDQLKKNSDQVAKYDSEISSLEKKSGLLETALGEIQLARKNAALQKDSVES